MDSDRMLDTYYDELSRWSTEMDDCIEVDEAKESDYIQTIAVLQHEKLRRLGGFLRTKKLWPEFDAADAKGERYEPHAPK